MVASAMSDAGMASTLLRMQATMDQLLDNTLAAPLSSAVLHVAGQRRKR